MKQLVLVLDFGGQYKELIASAVRGLSVYSEIKPGNIALEEIKRRNPIGLILTGGSNSVFASDAPQCDPKLFELGIPVLGISYGMQLMCHALGGKILADGAGEHGNGVVTITSTNAAQAPFAALMSHRNVVAQLPDGFVATARTASYVAACENADKKLYGVQFHPETKNTQGGREYIYNFLYDVCGAMGDYKLEDYINTQLEQIRSTVGNQKVLLALSGGVDSSVCAALLTKAVPGQLICIFVDHGLMRQNEGDEIERIFSKKQLNFVRVNAQKRFLDKLKNVTEPEHKRKIIGEEFIRVFEEEAAALGNIPFLAQGTIYPDIVESGGVHGATIKSHHNVGGLPEHLTFEQLVEPLSGLFKDEVRAIGRQLGLPDELVDRQPFPGPGLAVRVMGKITQERLDILRQADAILRQELDQLKPQPSQYFAVLTDTLSVGIKNEKRSYGPVVALRAVTTDDFMTCDYTPLPHELLGHISARIANEIPAVSRVVYDITSKPPATIEWE